MTNNAQRIKIGRACGWTDFHIYVADVKYLIGVLKGRHPSHTIGIIELPNYTDDLNACAEMENWLNEKYSRRSVNNHWRSYHIQLWKVVNPDIDFQWDSERWVDCIYATAPQRCEAFLKTLGLWEGE